MNDDLNQSDLIDSSTAIKPGKTPLVVGPGIVLKGSIVCENDDSEAQMMIMGRVEGDITTKGVIQIAMGGEVAGNSVITAGAIVIAGKLTGCNVSVCADLVVMHSTALIDVAKVIVPPGRLEMRRGSQLIGQLSRAEHLIDALQNSGYEGGMSKAWPLGSSAPSLQDQTVA